MSTGQTVSDQYEGLVPEHRYGGPGGPVVPRMLLGAQLRRLRKACGITPEEAGAAIRASHSKISRLELGRTGFKWRDVDDLLTLYGVADEAERATLRALAEQANAPVWWQPYGDVVPQWFQAYLGLEQAASVIRSYEVQFVPGLLQTADYARAVIALGHGHDTPAELDRRVGLRAARRQILRRAQPPHLWVIIDEAALRRPIGGAATMRAQLRHLMEVSEAPNITVQAMPFTAGGHAAAGGPVTLLRLPGGEIPDVVYLEQLTCAVYPDKTADIEYYRHVMDALSVRALQPAATLDLLLRILRET